MNNEMNRRTFLKSIAAITASSAVSNLSCSLSKEKQPNILFFLIDDLGWKDVGFMGSTFYETPNIDKLAKDGVHFTNAYANAPNCAPTRACLMSGQYTPRHGIYTVASSERGESRFRKIIPTPNKTILAQDNITFAEILQQSGYKTASMGKWHLGAGEETGPLGQGFDVNVAGNKAGAPKSYFSPYKNPDLTDGQDGEYLTDRLTDEAIKFIEQNKEIPFFLYLPHYAVHTPIQAKQKLIQKYKNKKGDELHNNPTYAAMIESMDTGIGRILNKLEELGLTGDTVIIFTSDNGGHGAVTSMAPLRGSKGMMYEGGIREPLIVKWPGKVEQGSVCEEPVITLDFYPTILEMAGCELPVDKVVDGVSLVSLITKKQKLNRDAVYWHFPAYLQTYLYATPWRTTPAGVIRKGNWKLIEFFEDDKLELYNLKDDISESTNVAEKFPQKLKVLHTQMKQWRQELNAPVPTDQNPGYDPTAVYKPRKR
jgi:arylsulfatase A-like enzyme